MRWTNVSSVVDAILKVGGEVLITADHGNAEIMVDLETGGLSRRTAPTGSLHPGFAETPA